ncbi:unnamed protein product [Prunus armeniaca]
MSVPHHLWGHAVLSAAYLINRTPSQVLDFKTLHDVFGNHVSPVSVSKLTPNVFGCVAYVHVYSHQLSKLDPCALRCVFIGYSSTHKGYKCYHPLTQKVYVTLDVTFHEEVPYYVSPSSPIQGDRGSELESLGLENLGLELENNVFEDTAFEKETTGITEVSDWSPISGDESGALGVETTSHMYLKIVTVILIWMRSMQYPPLPCQCPNLLVIVNQVSVCVPTKLYDALSNPKWMDAMNVEMDALNKNKIWDLHKADGSIDRYKARLVAKGYTQTYEMDYLETFALVAKLNTVHEEIYMDLPLGIPVTSKEGVSCKLWKSLYGLKQSPRAWFGRFAASMKKFGYVQSNSDHTLFLKRHKDKERYQRLVGKLIYLVHTRPDIAYAVSVVSQFMHSPSEDHMGAMMRILRYLKVTPDKGLMFCKYGHTDVEGYTDVDWAGSITDRRSASEYFNLLVEILLFGGVKSKSWCLGLVLRPSTVGWLKMCASYYS